MDGGRGEIDKRILGFAVSCDMPPPCGARGSCALSGDAGKLARAEDFADGAHDRSGGVGMGQFEHGF